MQVNLNCVLLEHTPNPERLVAAAARLCYSKSDAKTLMQNMTQEKVEAFVAKLESLGHESPFEHISFTFGIDGISRVLSHQDVRHRHQSISQQSQRYCDESDFNYIVPVTIQENDAALEIFVNTMTYIQNQYQRLVDLGIPKEDARYLLANATETKMVITFNARSLFNFFHHRCCSRAQWEIRALAYEMLKQVRAVAPNVFRHAGANCVKGFCPEASMCCGRAPTLSQLVESYKKVG